MEEEVVRDSLAFKPTLYDWVDESTLSIEQRLGLAYCRLSSFEWDSILGDDPVYERPNKFYWKKMQAIQEIIGPENTSKAWWVFNLRKTEDEWKEWYYGERLNWKPPAEEVEYPRKRSNCKKRCGKELKKLPYFFRTFFLKE